MEAIPIFKEDEILREELENRIIPSDFMINLLKIENRLKENKAFYKKPTIPKIKRLKNDDEEEFDEASRENSMEDSFGELNEYDENFLTNKNYREDNKIINETCDKLRNLSIEIKTPKGKKDGKYK